jgi:hypothetical protein
MLNRLEIFYEIGKYFVLFSEKWNSDINLSLVKRLVLF